MLIISWNVAGWSSTAAAIRAAHGGSVRDFLERTHADIVCLQECKGTLSKRTHNPVEMGASDPRPGPGGGIDGWESFWSFSSQAHRGFNGVVTFARKGLTWACDARPFAQDDLDDEGRVVVTVHSAFVLVNVYVPNARGGQRTTFKVRFLNALLALLARLRRETGKPAVLVGDLNLTYRTEDAAWTLRRIHLGRLVQLQRRAQEMSPSAWEAAVPHLGLTALRTVCNLVAHYIIDTLQQQQGQSQDDATQGAAVLPSQPLPQGPGVSRGGRRARRQPVPSTTQDEVCLFGSSPSRDLSIAVDAGLTCLQESVPSATMTALRETLRDYWRAGMLSDFSDPPLSLAALQSAGFESIFVDELLRRLLMSQQRDLYAVVRYCGLPPHGDASTFFLPALLHVRPAQDAYVAADEAAPLPSSPPAPRRMWDSFLVTDKLVQTARACTSTEALRALLDSTTQHEPEGQLATLHAFLPRQCPCPYTCWDQSRNRRQTNEGTRLDYILIDTELLPFVVSLRATENNTGPRCCAEEDGDGAADTDDDFFTEFDGKRRAVGVSRATCNARYPPAPFDGSGMPPVTGREVPFAFRGLPSTGLFVTPPQYSDHIGVCLRLDQLQLQPRPDKVIEHSKDCMYRPPATLHSFFAKMTAGSTATATATTTSTTTTTTAEPECTSVMETKETQAKSQPVDAGTTAAPSGLKRPREEGSAPTSVIDVDGL